MHPIRLTAALVAVALVAAACGSAATEEPTGSPSSSGSPSSTVAPSPDRTPSRTPSVTPTAAACDEAAVIAAIDESIAGARLTPVTGWSTDLADSGFASRATTAETFADRLGFDCGLLATETVGDDERLVLAAWTGPRMAWVVQTSESPTTPYAPEAEVTVLVGEATGEFLDGDSRALWAGTLSNGDTFVVGHVDYNLGATAKAWFVEEPPTGDDEYELAAERHAVAVLRAAGMREVGIAQPAEVGSAEGYVMFVSPTGQISVADVAPVGWFDPMVPRYDAGETRVETIDGARLRITGPGPDAPEYVVAAEVGFACDGYVWILQPPMNGTTDEAVATATAILGTDLCRTG